MNPNSRTVKIIETSLARLEAAVAAPMADGGESAGMDALGLLDEIRRLERKWVEQIAAGSPRRKPTDYAVMEGWCRRWLRATSRLTDPPGPPGSGLSAQRAVVEQEIRTNRFRASAAAMRGDTADGAS
jgi:hypothetical protein